METTHMITDTTAARVHALANVLDRPAHELVADAIELLRHQHVPATRPAPAPRANRKAPK